MSYQHFFLDTQVIAEMRDEVFELHLSNDDLHHIKVLRLKPSSRIAVIDAQNDYFLCDIVSFDKKSLQVRIAQKLDAAQKPYQCTLFQGYPKGQKLDTIIRQTTELGIDRIAPVYFSRSIPQPTHKGGEKQARLYAIAKSASMQSGRTGMPEVLAALSFDGLCQELASYDCVILFWEEATADARLHEALNVTYTSYNNTALSNNEETTDAVFRVAVIIGPEGGISEGEVAAIRSTSDRVHCLTMGNTILRTETAGVVATALVLYELNQLTATDAQPLGV